MKKNKPDMRGRWSVCQYGVITGRRGTLTEAKKSARIIGGKVRHWRSDRYMLTGKAGWEKP